MKYKRFCPLTLLVISLTGCGGGGSGSSQQIPIEEEVIGEIIQDSAVVSIGQSTELILFAPQNALSNIQWSQTGGPSVEFYAKNSKVIAFTPTESGNYSFQVEYVVDEVKSSTLSHSFDVGTDISDLTVRLGHAVLEENAVSLVSFAAGDESNEQIDKTSWRWEQILGPTVTFTSDNTDGESSVFFNAPSVNQDTILKFRLSGRVGEADTSDEISILVENSDIEVPESGPFRTRIADVYPYRPDPLAGQTLVDCVYSNLAQYDVCTFDDTPLIAQITTSPTVDDIMKKVIVSHDWMGSQFEKFLTNYDEFDDFKNLLRAVTAIVISYDIRPSFYNPTTGAIYLDPDDLWETPAQRDTINSAPDYRSGFGSELQFEMPWRYVKDNDYAYFYYPSRYRITRTLEDSKYSFAALLYHELAHANDFFPSTRWLSYSPSKTVYDAVNEVYQARQIESDFLQNSYPLDPQYLSGGNELTKLAQVRFRDPDSIQEYQKLFSMDDVANMFKTEGAPQFYSYSTTREDFAILFDGFMMYARYGVSRDVGVSDQAYTDFVWGQRDRKGEIWIKPRLAFVASSVLPEFSEASGIISELPLPSALDDNVSWRESVSSIPETSRSHDHKRDHRLMPMEGEIWHYDQRKSRNCGLLCYKDELKHE